MYLNDSIFAFKSVCLNFDVNLDVAEMTALLEVEMKHIILKCLCAIKFDGIIEGNDRNT